MELIGRRLYGDSRMPTASVMQMLRLLESLPSTPLSGSFQHMTCVGQHISGAEFDIANRETALETTRGPLHRLKIS